ncbi:tetratricopeptide repeat protein [Brachyspira aalborgi]|uniref:Tetratricopeptide repeat protein n=1 Tax=Brachyspira aalborgi TaxID=29522 RepID=A0A5C8EMT1_9SPIR|nr:tetratricopeptide repeat protein [Brachyspira aalborgi]TXJ39297.1 tetratricopeptide repeat protein [Brachyspira aalborgi]
MSELYKGVEKLQNKHYEEAAKDLYEFILKDKLTTNIDDAIKGRKEKDKLHLSNNELIELYKNSIKYFDDKINNLSVDLVAEAYFDLGVISIFTNQREYNPRYTNNEYLDKVFKLSNDIVLLGKLGVVYGKYEQYDKAIGCFEKILQIEPNNKEALDSIQAINNHRKK